MSDEQNIDEVDYDHDDDWHFDGETRDALLLATAKVEELTKEIGEIRGTDAWLKIAELEEAITLAAGPHCSGCGFAIDPDVCHCGTPSQSHGNVLDEGHGFVPAGCGCGYANLDEHTLKLSASGLRQQLWRARRRKDAAENVIARVRTIVQHWRSQDGFNVSLIDALGVALDAYDREPNDG